MELHLLFMVWFTALFFTALAFYVRNNWAFPLIAAIGWIATGMSFGEVAIYGFDGMGNVHPYYINMGDPHTAGMLGSYYYFWGIGIVLMFLTLGWVIMGREVGEEV